MRYKISRPIWILATLASLAGGIAAQEPQLLTGPLVEAANHPATAFETNQGQARADVRFVLRTRDYSLLLLDAEAVFVGPGSSELRMRFAGESSSRPFQESAPAEGEASYIIGRDTRRWLQHIQTYAAVRKDNVYPGIDAWLESGRDGLSLRLEVAPGADYKKIQLVFTGGDTVLDPARGGVAISTARHQLQLSRPVSYQATAAGRRDRTAAYVIGDRGIGLNIEAFDPRATLIISVGITIPSPAADVAFTRGMGGTVYTATTTELEVSRLFAAETAIRIAQYSTSEGRLDLMYLGGDGRAVATSLAGDAHGSVYVAGYTSAADFPTTPGALERQNHGGLDAFVAKVAPATGTLEISTLLGGQGNDLAFALALDTAANIYLAGYTNSEDFPAAGGRSASAEGDLFAVKLSSRGEQIEYSTVIGGDNIESARALVVDTAGRAYITGFTLSDNFPVTADALQPARSHGSDAFLARLDAAGKMEYGTFLGGDDTDEGTALALGRSGAVLVGGFTHSSRLMDLVNSQSEGVPTGFVATYDPSLGAMTDLEFVDHAGRGVRSLVVDSGDVAIAIGAEDRAMVASATELRETLLGGRGKAEHARTAVKESRARATNYTSLGSGGNVGCDIPLAVPSAADCDTALVENEPSGLAGRIPLIMIHGIHGNRIDPGFFDGEVDDASNYDNDEANAFDNLIQFLRATPTFDSKYKIYRFHYVSNKHRVYTIAQSLRNRLDRLRRDDSSFQDEDIVLLAHSMGGLVARAYMEKHHNDFGSKKGHWGGESVLKLITLGTPHHGTPGANGTLLRRHGQTSDNAGWNSTLNLGDYYYWDFDNGCGTCDTDTTAVNRSDLRWARYFNRNDIFSDVPDLYLLNSKERNDDLISMPHLFDSKISAYYGSIGGGFDVDILGKLNGEDLAKSALFRGGTAAGVLVQRVFDNNWTAWITFLRNDGVVPEESGSFAGGKPFRRVFCAGAEHNQLREDGSLSCTDRDASQTLPLFRMIQVELDSVNSVAPTGILQITPSPQWSFGSVGLGSSVTKQFRLANTGTSSVTITNLSLSGANGNFAMINPPSSLPIASGGSETVAIRFQPTSTGGKDATWVINYTGGSGSSASISLNGSGITAAPPNCTYQLSQASASFSAAGGSGGFTVTSGNGCAWQAVSSDPAWLTLNSPGGGNGSGTQAVQFTAASNAGVSNRLGSITVLGAGSTLVFYVWTDGNSPCTYSLSASDANLGAGASSGEFVVATGSACGWSVASNTPWVIVTAPGVKLGTLGVGFSVSANSGSSPRTGAIQVQAQGVTKIYSITQAPTTNSCTYSLQATQVNSTWPGGAGFVQIAAQAGCTWHADASVPWITLQGNTLGSGNGSVSYTVASNDSGAPRVGAVAVSGIGQTLVQTISQNSPPSNFPTITLPSNSISMGNALLNAPMYQTVAYQNTGSSYLFPGGIYRISGSSDFSVYSQPPALEPGGIGFFTILLNPSSLGSKSATFRITSNDPSHATIDLSISATAVAQTTGGIDFLWQNVTNIPAAVRDRSVAVLGSQIYILAGDQYRRFDPTVNAFQNISNPQFLQTDGGADAIGQKLYLVGGIPQTSQRVQIYNPQTDSWTSGPMMLVPRRSMAVAAAGNKLYVIGGENGTGAPMNTVEEYDPATDTWSQKAPMPTARTLAAAATVNGIVYVIGGSVNGVPTGVVEAYNPATNTWSTRENIPSRRFWAAAAVLNSKIYVIGGRTYTDPSTTAMVEEFDPAKPDNFPWTETWATRNILKAKRAGNMAGVVNGRIYVLGGVNIETSTDVMTVEEGVLGAAPILGVAASSLSLGSVPLGSMSEATIAVQNTGNALLTLGFGFPSGNQEFFALSTPANLAPNNSARIRVRFKPTALGDRSSVLKITSNDTSSPLVTVTLTASGAAPASLPEATTFEAVQTIPLPGSSLARKMIIDNGKAYVTRSSPPGFSIVDLATGAGTNIGFPAYPNADTSYPSLAGNRAFVPLSNLAANDRVAVIDLTTNAVSSYLPSPEPYGTTVANNRLYVSNVTGGGSQQPGVNVFDLTTLTSIGTLPLGDTAVHVAGDPLAGKVYVAGIGNNADYSPGKLMRVVNSASNTVAYSIETPFGTFGTAMWGARVYVLGYGMLYQVDSSSGAVLTSRAVDENLSQIAVNSKYVFLLEGGGGNRLNVLDQDTLATLTTITVSDPASLAVDPATDWVYVASTASHALTVIRPRQAAFTVGCAVSALPFVAGSTSSAACTVKSLDNFSSPVALGCTGLPQGASCVFTNAVVTPLANGSAQSSLAITVPAGIVPGVYGIDVTATNAGITRSSPMALTVSTCVYINSALGQNFGPGSAASSVQVAATNGCTWNATSNATWLNVDSGSPGSGSGILNFSIAANASATSRMGTMTIAGNTFTVTQAGISEPVAVFRDTSGAPRLTFANSTSFPSAGGFLAGPPTAAQAPNGDTYIVGLDAVGGVWLNTYAYATSTWNGWRFSGGILDVTSTLTVAVAPDGTAWFAGKDIGHRFWINSWSGTTFGGWRILDQGIFAPDSIPQIAIPANGSVYVIGKDIGGRVWSNHYDPSTGTFSGWRNRGAVIIGQPSVAAGADGFVYVAARNGAQSPVYLTRLPANNGAGANTWLNGGGLIASDPQIAAQGGTVYVTALAMGGAVYVLPISEIGLEFGSWSFTGGVLSDHTVAVRGATLYLAGRDNANRVWWYNRTTSAWFFAGGAGLSSTTLCGGK